MSLTENLKKLADQNAAKIPQEYQTVMQQAIDDLESSKLTERSLKSGDTIPEITLPNAKGDEVSVQSILGQGKKVVIAFYRGGWCPYCNLELRALQSVLSDIKASGAELIAITPETPDNSLSTTEKNELTFEVLSDKGNAVARKFNLVYTLPDELNEIYKKFGIQLDQSQGNTKNELPISATYVVDTNGKIIYDYIKEDYKLRADPNEVVQVLEKETVA